MGVRSLTQLVRRNRLLRREQLSGCRLVIDGSNLYWALFSRLGDSSGNICQAFTQETEAFFDDLRRCNIVPLVLLDGTYDNDCERLPVLLEKMETDITRTQSNAYTENPEAQSCRALLGAVFIDALRRMGISHATCLFEADLPVAAIARRLGCPVMTNDSDFFTLGVTCVQVPRHRVDLKFRHPGRGHSSYSMTCDVFDPSRLLEYFHMNSEMMAMVATLPGNDKFPRSVFDGFFEKHLYLARQDDLTRLETLMRWLADQRSLDQALRKVLECVCEDERERLEHFIATFHNSLDGACLDFLQDAEYMSFLDAVPPANVRAAFPETGFLKPPALRKAVARCFVPSNSINAIYGLPWRLRPALDSPLLPCSSMAAVPVLTRLSALVGAPVGPLVLYTVHDGRLRRLLTSCTWRAPLLERVLLGGRAARLEAALATLQLRPETLTELPWLMQLLAATLVVWRRATIDRSQRHHVRATLLCFLALTPEGTKAPELGLTYAGAITWRERATPLRLAVMPQNLFDLTAMHMYSELQGVFKALRSLNDMLDRPLGQLDVQHTLHPSLAMRLGFIGPRGGTRVEVGAEVESLVNKVTDAVEAEVHRCLDGDVRYGTAGEPWTPYCQRETFSAHSDLRVARALKAVLNKMADANAPRMRQTLRELTVETENGLYTLVDTIYRRAVAEPSEVPRCADVCAILADIQVKSDRGGDRTVRFADLLLTRLFLGVGPACRLPARRCPEALLQRRDLLEHLDTLADPAERWRQLGLLTACWRAGERRQLAVLQLLAAAARRRLVPAWAARRCLERLLGGDGETRQPPPGTVGLQKRPLRMEWYKTTPAVESDLLDLLELSKSDAR